MSIEFDSINRLRTLRQDAERLKPMLRKIGEDANVEHRTIFEREARIRTVKSSAPSFGAAADQAKREVEKFEAEIAAARNRLAVLKQEEGLIQADVSDADLLFRSCLAYAQREGLPIPDEIEASRP